MILVLCKAAKPLAIYLAQTHISSQENLDFYFLLLIMYCKKSPCQANQVTRQRWLSSQKASLYWMIFGCLILDRRQIQFKQLVLQLALRCIRLIFFKAQTLSSTFLLTLKTLEKDPSPIRPNIQKLIITVINLSPLMKEIIDKVFASHYILDFCLIKLYQSTVQTSNYSYCKQINIMSSQIVKEEIIDPQIIAQQFQKQEEIKKKLVQLQAPVFKNFTIKKSKSVIHTKYKSDKPSQIRLQIENHSEQLNQKVQNLPNITTICFASSIQKSSTPSKQVQSARTLPTFSPLKNRITIKKTATYIEENIQEPVNTFRKPLKHNMSQKIRSQQKRNSQTILRKNSLFLVSSLKTRYRQIQKRAHIGDIDGVANIKLGNFNQKTAGVTHYQQRFQYMQQARQRLLLARAFQGQSKLSRISPLLPEPW